ncbi:MAG: nuclear transport factor 2 family protein [Gemmataceae bacterium]|nr:nuclear transport factor 2 family protein [Gemmataceae bacterium]
MTAVANLDCVQKFYAALARGDIANLVDALAADVVWEVDGPAHLPFFGPRRGRIQVVQLFRSLASQLDVQEFTPKDFIVQDDKVVVLGYERGLARSTGRVYAGHWAHVFTLSDGVITAFRGYSDTATFAAAFEARFRVAA